MNDRYDAQTLAIIRRPTWPKRLRETFQGVHIYLIKIDVEGVV